MHRTKTQQHFLMYTIEHILGALFVVSVAMFVGYGAYAADSTTTTVTDATSLTTAIPGSYILTPPLLSLGSVVSGKVSLSWTAMTSLGAGQGYALYRNDINIAKLTVTTYEDSSGLTPGMSYVYSVKTIDTTGGSSASSNAVVAVMPNTSLTTAGVNTGVDTTPPTPPSLSVTTLTSTSVSLSFTGATDNVGVVGYKLFKNGSLFSSVSVTGNIDMGSVTPGAVMTFYAKAIDAVGNESPQSAQITVTIPLATGATTSATTTGVTQPVSTLLPVSFGVTVAPITDCASSKPMTEVFFVVSDPLGGGFELSSQNGVKQAPLEWGRYPLTNGIYTWKAIVKSGYVVNGESTGTFTLSGVCAVTTTATTTVTPSATPSVTADTFPLKYPESATVLPSVAIDTIRIKEGDIVSGVVTFDVIAKGSTRTVFVLESKTGTKQFIDKQLGVIHKDSGDEWSVLWNTANMVDGDYTLASLIDTSAGTMISKKFLFTVKNAGVATSKSIGVSLAQKPILKMYLNNTVVPSGTLITKGEQIEFRVGATDAKKIGFFAIIPTASSPIEVGQGVVDDLLSGKNQDVWTTTWDTVNANEHTYKVFARVLLLNGTVVESVPLPISVGGVADAGMSTRRTSNETELPLTKEEQKAILLRVVDVASCTTPDECRVFCATANATEACESYARKPFLRPDGNVSLARDIPKESIERVLLDTRKRSDIPELVTTSDDLVQFCANPAHIASCTQMLTKNDLATHETLEEKKQALLAVKEEEVKLLTERTFARSYIDSDDDAISDYDEVNIYHTDPVQTDTDHDGVPDGVEIMNHTNPHGQTARSYGTSTTAKDDIDEGVTFEDPLIAGFEKKEILKVGNVQVSEIGTNSEGTTTVKKLLLSGSALPNSFVTLYIFSTPIVVTVKADSSGAWTYTLDKELPDGAHQVVSAITDEGGHILAKSETLPFVKVAAAVSVGSNALLPTNETLSFFSGTSLYAFIAILIGLIGVAFSIIGFVVRTRTEPDAPLFPPIKK